DPNNGTAVGADFNTSTAVILRTTDGGATWVSQYDGTEAQFSAVSFTDANTGTAAGSSGTIVRTTDGGNTWVEQTSGTPNLLLGVSFTDANNGTVVGQTGEIIRTTDGGSNWVLQSTGITTETFVGVSFKDPVTGTAVGNAGSVLRTTDAGDTWINHTPTTTPLLAVQFLDANAGWISGYGGWDSRNTARRDQLVSPVTSRITSCSV